MARTELAEGELDFLSERHLGTLTTMYRNRPHVVAIAFAVEGSTVRIITSDGTRKVRNVEGSQWAVVCQVDGPRWLALGGPAHVRRDEESVAGAVRAFEARYRPVRENPTRVAIEIEIQEVRGRVG